MGWDLMAIAIVVVAYALVSGRLGGSPITPAIVFVAAGLLLGTEGVGVVEIELDSGVVRLLTEVTLALVLFTDAAALDTRALWREATLPTRLLGIGLPLTIVAGTLVALPLFPALGLFEAAALAILIAPTDAALGQTVVTDRRLPSRLRQGLNVESGLNDGVCVPLLFTAIALAELEEGLAVGGILEDLVTEVGVGVGVGVATAAVVAPLLAASSRRGWLDDQWAQVVPLAAVVAAYSATTELGGSGFIGAFAAGIAYRRLLGPSTAHATTKLIDEIGGLLSAVTFFVFGASLIGLGITDLDLQTVVYTVLGLTLIRMLPVAVALLGSGAAPPTVAFAGWFGPRGLATIVFMLVIVEESELTGTPAIVQVGTLTVLLSVLAHGLSAQWLTGRYLRWLSARREALAMEGEDAPVDMPDRRGVWRGAPRGPG